VHASLAHDWRTIETLFVLFEGNELASGSGRGLGNLGRRAGRARSRRRADSTGGRRDADRRPLRHVFHGLDRRVLYDLGDFLDDYAVNPKLRNDLGLLFLVDPAGNRLEAIPLKLEFAHTRLADGDNAAWVRRRFRKACAAFGTEVAKRTAASSLRWR
jgi:hypothetical protein